MRKTKLKLRKTYAKLLRALVKHKWDKARDLNAKLIELEFKIRKMENE